MPWIKRNLLFVVGLAVAVALLGFGVFYLLSSKGRADEAATQLDQKNGEFDQLLNADPYPSEENIKAARQEQARVQKFIESARPQFASAAVPSDLDNAAFKNLLEGAIGAMTRDAERSGVKLPGEKYSFTFDEQRTQLQIGGKLLTPLAAQLGDIRSICRILFDAKVHNLLSLKRFPVGGTNETVSIDRHHARKITTNSVTGASVHHYEVTFQSFSPELARVLSGFVGASEAIVVKSINVEPGSFDPAAAGGSGFAGPGGMDPTLAARYGMAGNPALSSRYGAGPGMAGRYGLPQAASPTTAGRPGDPALDDKPLRVMLGLEIVKLPPPAPAGKAPTGEVPAAPAAEAAATP